MDTVNDRHLEARGTPETHWQRWPGLARMQRIRDVEQLVATGGRAVVVAPHPDDEVLGLGGLICSLAEAGTQIVLVAVTDGGAHPGSGHWLQGLLESLRRAERHQGMAMLTQDRHQIVCLGLPEDALPWHRADIETQLDSLLRAGDTVFSTWRFDGHPDHEAVGQSAAASCERVGARLVEVPIWMWHWATPGDQRVPWERARALALRPGHLALKREAIRQRAETSATSRSA